MANAKDTDAPSERERWKADQQLRERELALRERNASWSSPLVMAVLLVAAAIFAHAAIFFRAPAQDQAQTQELRAATDRILAALAANTNAAPRDLANCPPANANPDLSLQWINVRCQYRFPRNDGFDGPATTLTLTPGTLVDRYGPPSGRFLAPANASYEARALPYDPTKMDYYRYEVVVAFDVDAGKVASWFDQAGGGTQYRTKKPIRQLLIEGSLKEVQRVSP